MSDQVPTISFPRQQARTRRFTLGAPRSFVVAGDGSRVAFLRSRGEDDPSTCLWVLDADGWSERLAADPLAIGEEGAELSVEERARRERARELARGIVAFDATPQLTRAVFALTGRAHTVDLASAGAPVESLPTSEPVFDPRIDPTGRRVAYVAGRALRLVDESGIDRALAGEDDPGVSWGLAEFAAAEEMSRLRGHWWSPDGETLAAARVDERPVRIAYISDPTNPEDPPRAVRYPFAGTDDAIVTLHLLRATDGARVDVAWDRERFPYLVRFVWTPEAPPTLLVMSRDQRSSQVLTLDEGTGATSTVREDHAEEWLEVFDGVPAWRSDGRLVMVGVSEDTYRVEVDGTPVTPPGLQVSRVLDAGEDVVFQASDEPAERHLWRARADGTVERLTDAPGVHTGAVGADVLVVASASMQDFGATVTVRRGDDEVARVASNAAVPVVTPRVEFSRSGPRDLRTALLLPHDHRPGQRIPVLMDPYGGPHVNLVVSARNAYLESQWWADQGFAVIVADNRGTSGRGPAWDRTVLHDFANPVLEDQVDALHAVAAANPDLDLGRVGIRGWSFGGYVAALAVLRRPDVFHAAVAGAPVTEEGLYDTFYTERYMGHPSEHPEAYEHNSLIADAASLRRPLLMIHGLSDDNVLVANTLRLSGALLAAGRPHEVLLLTGMTHMVSSEELAENLLLLQLEFLRRSLPA
ncbi:MAG TPA: prolyl oligopeptidase family serine peptidase [Actinomycetota bacterium]|nr:prolyl oligopeptidase family serine peptidase [Actinomycetota bacterium]